MNLDAILRIAAKVTGTDAVQALGKAVKGAETAATGAKNAFKDVVKSSSWQAAAAAAAGIGVALGTSVKAAIDFESAIADVRKVVNGIDTPQGLKDIRTEILNLSKQMPITAQGFAQIYAAAGQSGIARNELQAFARDVAQMSIAFDMTAEEAGTAMAKLRTSLGLSQLDVVKLADAMNYLSNNTASTASQLTQFVLRAGAVGQMTGLSAQQTAAFGAAMIGAGVETEVAATSFNNMVKALSRGASMTDRQESALRRLGLASGAVTRGERDMTSEVQRQSDRRLQIMQDASDRQQSELRKRYRRQLQLLQDQWDDEAQAFDDGIRKQTEAQIKDLQRQADARIKALQKQAGNNQEWLDQQTDAVRDQLDQEIEAIRDAADQTLKLDQRARRDRQQETRDGIEERMDIELKGMQRAAQQREKLEQESTKKILEAAKSSAGEGGSAAGKALAEAMQRDALGTIQDVFRRIKGLAPAERISVISDLFGDEARGLSPLLQNLGGLEKALSLVGDETQYAGSMAKEYEARAATTANAIQQLKNSVVPLQVELGEALVPIVQELTKALIPAIGAITDMMQKNPELAKGIALVAAAFAGLVAAIPFIAAIGTIAAGMAPFIAGLGVAAAAIGNIGTILAGVMTVVAVAASGIGTALAAIGAAIAAVATAPVLLTIAIAAAVAAVVAAVYLWRDEIGKFFQWLGQMAVEGWNALIAPLRPAIDSIVAIWSDVTTKLGEIYSGLARTFYQLFIEPTVVAVQAFGDLLISFWSAAFDAVAAVVTQWVKNLELAFNTVADLYFQIVIKPITDRAQALWRFLSDGWTAFSSASGKVFRAIADAYQNIVVKPLVSAWKTVVDTAKSALRGMLGWAASAINGVINMVNRLIDGVNKARKAMGLSTIGRIGNVTVPKFAQGGYVTAPTLGLVGEAGREYIVPESKAAGFANNIMAGRRGAAAIPSGTSSNAGPVQINITTGPIMQDQSGQRWMTIEDGERLARQTAEQVQRQLRTPGGRYAAGVR